MSEHKKGALLERDPPLPLLEALRQQRVLMVGGCLLLSLLTNVREGRTLLVQDIIPSILAVHR